MNITSLLLKTSNILSVALLSVVITSYHSSGNAFAVIESTTAAVKPNIVVSIKPLAEITAMLTGDSAIIHVIDSSSSCPHTHSLKPSDKTKTVEADFILYIADDFDGFVKSMMEKKATTPVLKITDKIPNMFIAEGSKINDYHFWLNLEKVTLLLETLGKELVQNFPEMQQEITRNLKTALRDIAELNSLKQKTLANISELLLFSNSLDSFFPISDKKIVKLQGLGSSGGLASVAQAEIILKDAKNIVPKSRCAVIDSSFNSDFLKKYRLTIVEMDGENWGSNNHHSNSHNETTGDFILHYRELIAKLQPCTIGE